MTIAGVELADHLLAAGCIALLIAGQCLRNALYSHGEAWAAHKARSQLKPVEA